MLVTALAEGGKLTTDGIMYLKLVTRSLKQYGIYLNFTDLEHFILNAPPMERVLVQIEINPDKKEKSDTEKMLLILMANLPFCADINTRICNIPPHSLIRFIFSAMSEQPMLMLPAFGHIGLKEHELLHRRGKHMAALYSRHARDNATHVHTFHCGPFPAWLHDVAHTFWANLLQPAERDIIYGKLIPFFSSIKQRYPTDKTIAIIDNICMRLNDFDLSPARDFRIKTARLSVYVSKIIMNSLRSAELCNMHQSHADKILTGLLGLAAKESADNTTNYFWYQLIIRIERNFRAVLDALIHTKYSSSPKTARLFHPPINLPEADTMHIQNKTDEQAAELSRRDSNSP
jgi:hypothetical protein